jgi:hypothetical protein
MLRKIEYYGVEDLVNHITRNDSSAFKGEPSEHTPRLPD